MSRVARRFSTLAISTCLVALAACETVPPKDGTTIDRIREVLTEEAPQPTVPPVSAPPPEVSGALLPPVTLGGPVSPTESIEPRFDVAVNDVPAQELLMGLVEDTPYNMVVHPAVSGTISLSLKNVTIPEVMQILRDVYGYEYEATRSGFYVLPVRLQSRNFHVNYLNLIRAGRSQTRVSTGQLSDGIGSSGSDFDSGPLVVGGAGGASDTSGSRIVTNSQSDLWSELASAVRAIVGTEPGRSVVVNPQTGIVVVRAMPAELREVEEFLEITQDTLTRQVIIDAKILEVTLDDAYQAGINWAALITVNDGDLILGQTGGGSGLDSGVSEIAGNEGTLNPRNFTPIEGADSSAFGGVFTANVSTGNFKAFMELLETQGNVQVLSSPRVSTVNNQKAVIKVGTDEFFVTDISNTTVTGGGGTTTSPDITLTPFFSGVALDVTPQIDSEGTVVLHIHPSVSEVEDETKVIDITGQTLELPLAVSDVRESDSIVSARSGELIVIGGLMNDVTTEDIGATPFLGGIPFLGSLFRQTRQDSVKSELVILLRPQVVESPEVWRRSTQRTLDRVNELDRGFHFGSRPEVFGTMGERQDQ